MGRAGSEGYNGRWPWALISRVEVIQLTLDVMSCVYAQGTVTPDKCVVCPAHGTAFDLKTGEVKGEWCPKVSCDCPCTGAALCWHGRLPFTRGSP